MRVIGRKSSGSGNRYGAVISREEGTIIKDWGGRLPVALIYPNSYFLGMSNLGIHTIYRLLNEYRNVVCERVFHEKESKNPPVSIESSRPLTDFSVVAFSLSYELDYFNVIDILRSSGIPLRASDRDERHPLVIAGGPCMTANPMPLAPFFDCLCIGEAEAILPAILPVIIEGIGESRQELIKALAALPGIYAPAYPPESPVTRQWVKNLDNFNAVSTVFTPDTELGDMYLIEVERGCQRGCRFCLVNTIFSPMRFRAVENIIVRAREGIRYRRRIGLVGPAVADHPQIVEILSGIRGTGAELSISSLRIGSLTGEILSELSRARTRTIAIAPEAGSDRLRQLINKGITDEEILQAADIIAGQDFRQLKLYFILGLPTETDDDVEGIIKLTTAIKSRLDMKQSNIRITLNAAPFVPKAGTPFQWLPMAPLEALNSRLSLLRASLPLKGIRLNEESPAWSHIQCALARGDESLAPVLEDTEEVTLSGWRRAVEKHQLDIDYYVNQRWDTDIKLPWAIIDSSTKQERLCEELEKALAIS
jgi:radical SAM superfamily enzyme YgiQ (UPF0313 family)